MARVLVAIICISAFVLALSAVFVLDVVGGFVIVIATAAVIFVIVGEDVSCLQI
jgi:hypothetical protein